MYKIGDKISLGWPDGLFKGVIIDITGTSDKKYKVKFTDGVAGTGLYQEAELISIKSEVQELYDTTLIRWLDEYIQNR